MGNNPQNYVKKTDIFYLFTINDYF